MTSYYYNYKLRQIKQYRSNMTESDMKSLSLIRIDDIDTFRLFSDNEKDKYVYEKLGGEVVVAQKKNLVAENNQIQESDEHIELSELESLQKRFIEIFGNQKRITEKQMNNVKWLKKQINSINI